MKCFSWFSGFMIFGFSLLSQINIIPNGNFETVTSTNINKCLETGTSSQNDPAVFDAFIQNWKTARHGISASTKNNDVGHANVINTAACNPDSKCSAFPTSANFHYNNSVNRFVRIRADYHKCGKNNVKQKHGAIGVALENGATFSMGTTYIIRYKIVPIRAFNNDNKGGNYCSNDDDNALFCHLRFFLSELGPANWNKNSSDKQELISVNFTETLTDIGIAGGFTNCSWKQVERKFIPNQGNYTTLVVFAEKGGACIDEVEVFEECENNKYIQDKYYNNMLFAPNGIDGFNFGEKAGLDLYAGKNVNSAMAQGDVILDYGSKVNYTAVDNIVLLDGFSVQPGADFTAMILPCPNNFNRLINPNTNPDPNYIIPAPLIADEDIVSDDEQTNEIFNISIFPNPNNGQFNIQLREDEELPTSISIQNILGQVILYRDVTSNNTKIDLYEAPKGIYMVLINYKESTITKKIVKQ